jgi:hypothetical protein
LGFFILFYFAGFRLNLPNIAAVSAKVVINLFEHSTQKNVVMNATGTSVVHAINSGDHMNTRVCPSMDAINKSEK